MTSKDMDIVKMMRVSREAQAHEYGTEIAERVKPDDKVSSLRWTGQNPDWRELLVAKLHSIFPRVFKAVQEFLGTVTLRISRRPLRSQ
jgi:hypothetical protein